MQAKIAGGKGAVARRQAQRMKPIAGPRAGHPFARLLRAGHFCPTFKIVRGDEFIRRVTRLGKAHGIAVRFDKHHGKGSHGTLYYGTRKTTVKDRRKEIGPGLLLAMLAQLGLNKSDLD